MRGLAAWILSLAVVFHGGFVGSAARAEVSSALCVAPPLAAVYLASAGGSTDWLSLDSASSVGGLVAPECGGRCSTVCVKWVDGHMDWGCQATCTGICLTGCYIFGTFSPACAAFCGASCAAQCYIPGHCAQYQSICPAGEGGSPQMC